MDGIGFPPGGREKSGESPGGREKTTFWMELPVEKDITAFLKGMAIEIYVILHKGVAFFFFFLVYYSCYYRLDAINKVR